MKIGIAGVGGIGSNVAMNLVRSGIFNLKFGDFDRVELSNLNRQFYFYEQIGEYKVKALEENLKKIDMKGKYSCKIIKFTSENIKEFFSECDIVVEGFDKKEYKSMFIEELLPSEKLLIVVSGIGGIDTSNIKVIKKFENLWIVGDMESDISKNLTYSHKVGMIAGKIVEIILKEVKKYEREDRNS